MSAPDPKAQKLDLRAAFEALCCDAPAPLDETHHRGALGRAIQRLVLKTKPWRRNPPGW